MLNLGNIEQTVNYNPWDKWSATEAFVIDPFFIKLKNTIEVKYNEFISNKIEIHKWDESCARNGIEQEYMPFHTCMVIEDGFVIMPDWIHGAGSILKIPVQVALKMVVLGW